MTQNLLYSAAVFRAVALLHSLDRLGELGQDSGDVDSLWTHLDACATGKARGGQLLFRHGAYRIAEETWIAKARLIVQGDQLGDIELLRTDLATVAAGGAGHHIDHRRHNIL